MIINTNEFILIPTVKDEISYFWSILNQKESASCWRDIYHTEENFYNDMLIRMNSRDEIIWTAWRKAGKSTEKMGGIILSDIDDTSCTILGAIDLEFYKSKARKTRHKLTLADKVLNTVLRSLFTDLKLARVNAEVYKAFPNVVSFLRRNGFKRNAVFKDSIRINDTLYPTYIYGITAKDFLKGDNNG